MKVSQQHVEQKRESAERLLVTTSLNFTLKMHQTLERHVAELNKNLPPIRTRSEISKMVSDGSATLAEAQDMLKSRPAKPTKRTVIETALTEYFKKRGVSIELNSD